MITKTGRQLSFKLCCSCDTALTMYQYIFNKDQYPKYILSYLILSEDSRSAKHTKSSRWHFLWLNSLSVLPSAINNNYLYGTDISETRKSLIIRRAMISPKVGTKDWKERRSKWHLVSSHCSLEKVTIRSGHTCLYSLRTHQCNGGTVWEIYCEDEYRRRLVRWGPYGARYRECDVCPHSVAGPIHSPHLWDLSGISSTIIIIFIFVTITFYDHPHKDRLAHWTEQHNKFRGRGGNMVMTTTLQGGNTKERRRKNLRACFMDPLFDWHLIAEFSCNVSE